jgi:hypothetical protein
VSCPAPLASSLQPALENTQPITNRAKNPDVIGGADDAATTTDIPINDDAADEEQDRDPRCHLGQKRAASNIDDSMTATSNKIPKSSSDVSRIRS